MENREGAKTGMRIASRIGGAVLTGATGAMIITAVPYAAPIVLCEKIAVMMIAGIVSDKVAEQSDGFMDELYDLKDSLQEVWAKCKEEYESR